MTNRAQAVEMDSNVDYRTVAWADSLFKCKDGVIRAHQHLIPEGHASSRSAAFGRGFR
jgi:hypothetical protein